MQTLSNTLNFVNSEIKQKNEKDLAAIEDFAFVNSGPPPPQHTQSPQKRKEHK
jgi:hypothetical protein